MSKLLNSSRAVAGWCKAKVSPSDVSISLVAGWWLLAGWWLCDARWRVHYTWNMITPHHCRHQHHTSLSPRHLHLHLTQGRVAPFLKILIEPSQTHFTPLPILAERSRTQWPPRNRWSWPRLLNHWIMKCWEQNNGTKIIWPRQWNNIANP